MAGFILFLNRIINLYMYYIGFACLLSWVPNINPNYPLFHSIFVSAGFYLFPPMLGISFSPLLLMVICAIISRGLLKLYIKINKDKHPEILVLSPEEFFEKLEQEKLKQESIENNKEENYDGD